MATFSLDTRFTRQTIHRLLLWRTQPIFPLGGFWFKIITCFLTWSFSMSTRSMARWNRNFVFLWKFIEMSCFTYLLWHASLLQWKVVLYLAWGCVCMTVCMYECMHVGSVYMYVYMHIRIFVLCITYHISCIYVLCIMYACVAYVRVCVYET